jgi:hypothetical protein
MNEWKKIFEVDELKNKLIGMIIQINCIDREQK